jgi:biopolymer transport protein ExbD
MGMSVGGGSGHDTPTSTINTTPLVDVMLVMLIIFMITAPLMSSKVQVELPRATYETESEEDVGAARAVISVQNQAGMPIYYWDDELIQWQGLIDRLRLAALRNPQPELRIRADRTVRYQAVSEVLQQARRIGVRKVSFITHPEE